MVDLKVCVCKYIQIISVITLRTERQWGLLQHYEFVQAFVSC